MSTALKLHLPDDDDYKAFLAHIDGLDADALVKELGKWLGISVHGLVRASAVWGRLRRMGHDLSGIKDGFALYLPQIEAGTVLAELVVAFARTPAVLKRLVTLTPADQRRMVDGEPVQLVVREGDTFTVRMLPVQTLGAAQVRQVIGDGTIRTEREQIALLCQKSMPWKPGRKSRSGRTVVDRRAGVVRIGKAEDRIEDVIAALKAAGAI